METTRRAFFGTAALFGASLVMSRALLACAVDPSRARGREDLGEGQDGLETCQPATIGHNHAPPHEHILIVDPGDLLAGADKTYSIKGNAGHDHQVTISAEQFVALAAGTPVVITSTTVSFHSHVVTVSCVSSSNADAGPGPGADGAVPAQP
jgi:hypothetical protein